FEPVRPGWLARRFWTATALVWVTSLAIPALLAREFGWTVVGEGMSPAIDIGESVLFRRRIEQGQLHQGTVVLFRLPPQTRVGEPGMLLAGRLLAVPDDTISIRKGKYVVNDETTDYLAEKKLAGAAVDVPKWPQTLKVREGRYFVVQDTPRPGLDSRSISWIHDRDLVSARLIHVGRGQLLQPVE
ncbi:MAG TPA: signal peptidase I, partial [Pirellulales bacterium]|nr:signal peptidase I [Pirellulales bacterium]